MKLYAAKAAELNNVGLTGNNNDQALDYLESVAREIGQNTNDEAVKQSVTKWFFAKLDIGSESRDKEAPISPFLTRACCQNIADTGTKYKNCNL